MAALHAAPGVFELQRSNSFQENKTLRNQYALGEEDTAASQSNTPHESDYEEEEVDESVREDMAKLEDTFPGISDRFRLMNRIGEGIENSSALV
jgi:cell division control protein 7